MVDEIGRWLERDVRPQVLVRGRSDVRRIQDAMPRNTLRQRTDRITSKNIRDSADGKREPRMPGKSNAVSGRDRRENLADRMALKSRIADETLDIFRQADVAVNLNLDEAVEDPAQGPGPRIERWRRRLACHLRQTTRHGQVVDPEGATSLLDLCQQLSHDRLQHLEDARAFGRAVFVAATERERRTPGDVRTEQEVARAETRRRAVGMVHDLERTVLGATGRCGVDPVVGTAEEAVLPQVTLAARERRGLPLDSPASNWFL